MKDPDFVSRSLDTMRRIYSLILPYINKHKHKRGEDELVLPEFHYSINQPQDSMIIADTAPLVKTKTTENTLLRKSSFDFSKAKDPISKNTILKIFKDFNFLKENESVLVLKTSGDIFQYDNDGKGYTGDWKVDVEVTKLLIIHFLEGKGSRNALLYVSDYETRRRETNYSEERYRYEFKNIQYCGKISADFDRDFNIYHLVRYKELN